MFKIFSIYIQRNPAHHEDEAHAPGPHLLGRVEPIDFPPVLITFLIFIVVLAFIIGIFLKEHDFMIKLTKLAPTSAILIIFGILTSLISHAILDDKVEYPLVITADFFQHVLIFPILLFASYTLYNERFLRQIPSVLFLSFFGTFLNIIMVAGSLKLIEAWIGISFITLTQCIVFGSLISVVDPLAVVYVFKGSRAEAGINFYLPFGAAVLGYGVSMEFFEGAESMASFTNTFDLPTISVVYVLLAFWTDLIAGAFVGCFCGLISAVITKYCTRKDSAYFEPIITLGFALFAYVICLDFGFSYIFSTIACGLLQARYNFVNMSPKGFIGNENIIFSVASLSELIMFLFIGFFLVNVDIESVWRFTLASIVIIYVLRIVITLGLSLLLNLCRFQKLSFNWQLLVFSGHKGPMSFVICLFYTGPFNALFRDTTLLLVLFSVMVDGVVSRFIVSRIMDHGGRSATGYFVDKSGWYGGNEIANILGIEKHGEENEMNAFTKAEKKMLKFFLRDESRISNMYRIQEEAKRELMFEKLEKHAVDLRPKLHDSLDEESTSHFTLYTIIEEESNRDSVV